MECLRPPPQVTLHPLVSPSHDVKRPVREAILYHPPHIQQAVGSLLTVVEASHIEEHFLLRKLCRYFGRVVGVGIGDTDQLALRSVTYQVSEDRYIGGREKHDRIADSRDEPPLSESLVAPEEVLRPVEERRCPALKLVHRRIGVDLKDKPCPQSVGHLGEKQCQPTAVGIVADDHLDAVGSEVLHQCIKVSPGANTLLIRQKEVLKSLYRGVALLHGCQADVVSPGGKGTSNAGTDRFDPAHDRIEGPPIDKRYIQNSLL